ncbi:hypothetical protein [Flavobacterium rivuli]|nr:hypothetical protein [Flavobacterium rivuli]
MKRVITITTCCICFAYISMAVYNLYPSHLKKFYLGKTLGKIKHQIGLGVLFDRPNSLIGKSVIYRLYQNGKWQENQQLLEPLFNDYKENGNFAALKHCRLDSQLAGRIHTIGKRQGIEKMKQSKKYKEFINHLIYRHNKNVKPDSLQIFYYIKDYKSNKLHLSLNFVCQP